MRQFTNGQEKGKEGDSEQLFLLLVLPVSMARLERGKKAKSVAQVCSPRQTIKQGRARTTGNNFTNKTKWGERPSSGGSGGGEKLSSGRTVYAQHHHLFGQDFRTV